MIATAAWPKRVALTVAVAAAALALGPGADRSAAVLSVDASASQAFKARVNNCIAALVNAGGLSLKVVETVDLYTVTRVVIRSGKKTETTRLVDPTQGDRPIVVTWNATAKQVFQPDRVERDPCASLLHELQHAADFDSGSIGGSNPHGHAQAEPWALKVENWYRWQLGLPQRFFYSFLGPGGVRATFVLPATANWPAENPPVPKLGKPVRVKVKAGGKRLAGKFPRLVVLKVKNTVPEIVFVQGRYVVALHTTQDMNCGGNNPAFRVGNVPRSCQLRFPIYLPPVYDYPHTNPYDVPQVTLRAIVDPNGVLPGQEVVWRAKGKRLPCGGNVYDHYCKIELGTPGVYGKRLAKPRSVTVTVTIESARLARVESARARGTWKT